jgi:hypothetical protein
MDERSENWGGKRLNAGLPKIEGGRRVLITLKSEHIEMATILGNGNMSLGIRKALEALSNGVKRIKN